MKKAGIALAGLLAVVVVIALAFAMELGGLKWKAFFAPKHEEVRRQVFKQTRSYNEAKVQDLARYRLQHSQADTDGKEALASTIRIMFADYDRTLLPNELAAFLYQVRGY